jgi:hypothetical protein
MYLEKWKNDSINFSHFLFFCFLWMKGKSCSFDMFASDSVNHNTHGSSTSVSYISGGSKWISVITESITERAQQDRAWGSLSHPRYTGAKFAPIES